MSLEIKIIAGALLFLILGCAVYFEYRSVYSAGVKYGSTKIQAEWDQDKASIQTVTNAAIAQANAQRDMALQANEGIANDYQAKLSAAAADAQSLAHRLSDAQGRLAASSSALPEAGSGQAPASASSAPGDDQLTGAVAAVFAECTQNADQLDALSAELKPQL